MAIQRSTVTLAVTFHSDAQRAAFEDALTGNDHDVLLAVEQAIQARIDPEGAIADREGAAPWVEVDD